MFEQALHEHRWRGVGWIAGLLTLLSIVPVVARFGDWRALLPIDRNRAIPTAVDDWGLPPERVIYYPEKPRPPRPVYPVQSHYLDFECLPPGSDPDPYNPHCARLRETDW